MMTLRQEPEADMDMIIGRVAHLNAVLRRAIRTPGIDPDKDIEDIAIYDAFLDIHLRGKDQVEAWGRMFAVKPVSHPNLILGSAFHEAKALLSGREVRVWVVDGDVR